jgi:hypothetical protein
MKTCDVCIKAKSFELPFNTDGPRTSENVPLKLVDEDVKGPLAIFRFEGARYYVTFIDDCGYDYGLYTQVTRRSNFLPQGFWLRPILMVKELGDYVSIMAESLFRMK